MGVGTSAGTALLRDASPWTLLAGAAAVAMLFYTVQMLEWAWWGPRRMDRALRAQGLRGTQYRFLTGDLKEEQRLMVEARSRPVPMDRAHDIIPRVAPLLHHVMKEHGMYMCQLPFVLCRFQVQEISFMLLSEKEPSYSKYCLPFCSSVQGNCSYMLFKMQEGFHIHGSGHTRKL
jgi:hypothetical protein